jgi:hypothetical protein
MLQNISASQKLDENVGRLQPYHALLQYSVLQLQPDILHSLFTSDILRFDTSICAYLVRNVCWHKINDLLALALSLLAWLSRAGDSPLAL